MSQISLIRPIEMTGQAVDHQKTQSRSKATDDDTNFDTHYDETSSKEDAEGTVKVTKEASAQPTEPVEQSVSDQADKVLSTDEEEVDAFIAGLAAEDGETPSALLKTPDTYGMQAAPDAEADALKTPVVTGTAEASTKADTSVSSVSDLMDPVRSDTSGMTESATRVGQKSITAGVTNVTKPAAGLDGAIARNMAGEAGVAKEEASAVVETRLSRLDGASVPADTQVPNQQRSKAAETVAAVAQRLRIADHKPDPKAQPVPEPQMQAKTTATVPTASVTASQPVITVAQVAVTRMQALEKEPSQLLNSDADPDLHAFDLRQGTTATQAAHQTARPAMPPSMMAQLVDIARAAQDKPVHVSLNPEELGKVRMSVSTAETGVTLLIVAEKAETLDLMRRNMDQIAREMASAGFTNLQLSFGEGQGSATGENSSENSGQNGDSIDIQLEDTATAETPDNPAVRSTIAHDGSLDLRL